MLSVILNIPRNAPAKLAQTLQNLVPYAIEGFVLEVIVLHEGMDDVTQLLADEAGCNLRQAPFDMGEICGAARGDWLLFMESGATLQAGWADVVSAHAQIGGGAASFKLKVSDSVPWWKRVFAPATTRSPLTKGFLISKRQARANVAGKSAPVDMMRGLAVKRLRASIVAS